jgi:hypothetical protein
MIDSVEIFGDSIEVHGCYKSMNNTFEIGSILYKGKYNKKQIVVSGYIGDRQSHCYRLFLNNSGENPKVHKKFTSIFVGDILTEEREVSTGDKTTNRKGTRGSIKSVHPMHKRNTGVIMYNGNVI